MRHACKYTITAVRLSFLTVALCFSFTMCFGQFAGGSGTKDDPWQVADARQLSLLKNYLGAEHQDKFFIQTADIDLGVSPHNEGEGWVPIAYYRDESYNNWGVFSGNHSLIPLTVYIKRHSFRGHYDGRNYRIRNLYINRDSHFQGLFGLLEKATIKNIVLDNVNIKGTGYAGALAGSIKDSTYIYNCTSQGVVRGNLYTGGLIGMNEGSVINRCISSADVITHQYGGGLAGRSRGGSIIESFSSSMVTGHSHIGGLVGDSSASIGGRSQSIILRSFAAGGVKASSQNNAGGLVAHISQTKVEDSFSSSFVESRQLYSACFIGRVKDNSIVRNSYAVGQGNFIGDDYGGFAIAEPNSKIISSYWDKESTGQLASTGATAKNTKQMMKRTTFEDWDFENVWSIDEGYSYPYLRWLTDAHGVNMRPPCGLRVRERINSVELSWNEYRTADFQGYRLYRNGELLNQGELITDNFYSDQSVQFFKGYYYSLTAVSSDGIESFQSNKVAVIPVKYEGKGTEEDPYIVETTYQLSGIRHYLGSHFRLEANIDLGKPPYNIGKGWQPIGYAGVPFTGSFDGNGFNIKNLTLNNPQGNYQGFFRLTNSAKIQNTGFINVDVNGSFYVGAIAGQLIDSTVRNCFVTGRINAEKHAGGISGNLSRSSGGIINCYNAASITTTRGNTGGLTGVLYKSAVINSYSTGRITCGQSGRAAGALAGSVRESKIINSFWDISMAGIITSSTGGRGLSSVRMAEKDVFKNWDFENVWAIGFNDKETYPWLQFQKKPAAFNYPDNLPPSNLNVQTHRNIVRLSWEAPDQGNPTNYNIYRNDRFLAAVRPNHLTYIDNSVEDYGNYKYYVVAIYGSEESRPSAPASLFHVKGGFAGGDGTKDNPYQVSEPVHLNNVRIFATANFIQTADIDMRNIHNWVPIGNDHDVYRQIGDFRQIPFSGRYDGNGYSIKNLAVSMDKREPTGLFGTVGYRKDTVNLVNVKLENFVIKGSFDVGGLVGRATHSTKIVNCHVSGIVECTSGNDSSYFGGLVGFAEDLIVLQSSSRGSVSAKGKNVGGLVGAIENGRILESYSLSDVYGIDNVGGLVGLVTASRSASHKPSRLGISIGNCFARGNVTGTGSNIGVFIGSLSRRTSIRRSYAAGDLNLPASEEDKTQGFYGAGNDYISMSYWKTDIERFHSGHSSKGRPEELMKYPFFKASYYGWDFTDIWQIDPDRKVNDGFPFFQYWDETVRDADLRVSPEVVGSYDSITLRAEPAGYLSDDYGEIQHSFLGQMLYNTNYGHYLFITVLILIGGMVAFSIYYLAFMINIHIGALLILFNTTCVVVTAVLPELSALYLFIVTLLIGMMAMLSRFRVKNSREES